METISKEEFKSYENIRESDITNMFDSKDVIRLSNNILNRDKIMIIMKNYGKLMEKFESEN